MKKFFCFHCQEDVKPHGFWFFRFCPKCHRHMTDKGDGFYKVCDICGSNLPTDAQKCLRCGYNFKMENAVENFEMNAFFGRNTWISWILVVVALIFGFLLSFCVLYVSFYVAGALLLFGLIVFLFNLLRARLHI